MVTRFQAGDVPVFLLSRARVAATRSLAMGRVPAGTVGRIVKVGFFGGYDVDFGRGRVLHDLSRDALRLPDGGSWWTRPWKR